MGLHRSWTGHTCVTKNEAHTGWQGNVARVQGAGMGISSSRFLPTSKPANDAADGRQINVLMAAMLQMPSGNDGGCAHGEHYGTLITANDGRT